MTKEEVEYSNLVTLYEDPQFVSDLLRKSNSSGARIFTINEIKNSYKAIVGSNQSTKSISTKALVRHMTFEYLKIHGNGKDIDERYSATHDAIKQFCEIQFCNKGNNFRWSDMSLKDQRIMELIAEHFVKTTVSEDFRVPLDLADDSWAVRMMLGVQIKNDAANGRSGRAKVKFQAFRFKVIIVTNAFFFA